MRLAQDNDVVQTRAPDRSDQPFGKAILPRCGWCGGLVPDAHGTQAARDDNARARQGCAAHPTADFRCSFAVLAHAALSESAVALPVAVISNANNNESQPGANAPRSRNE